MIMPDENAAAPEGNVAMPNRTCGQDILNYLILLAIAVAVGFFFGIGNKLGTLAADMLVWLWQTGGL